MSWRNWRPTRKFFAALEQCDQEIACRLSEAARCLRCGGGLHRADFPRKPMGCTGLSSGPCRRVSFCCRQRDCRRRLTPPSFRFPDRKWYVLFVVLLAAAVGPSGPEHVTGVVEVAGASPSLRSVRRWQRHFRTFGPTLPTVRSGSFCGRDCYHRPPLGSGDVSSSRRPPETRCSPVSNTSSTPLVTPT